MVDRGHVPLMGSEGAKQYVVVEPIQGFASSDNLLVFCFPPLALLSSRMESSDGVRLIFDMHGKEDCSAENEDEIRQMIEDGMIRRYSLPEEY